MLIFCYTQIVQELCEEQVSCCVNFTHIQQALDQRLTSHNELQAYVNLKYVPTHPGGCASPKYDKYVEIEYLRWAINGEKIHSIRLCQIEIMFLTGG